MVRNARRLQPGGFKAGLHSGRFHASNVRCGYKELASGGGTKTADVAFEKSMPNGNYKVLLCSQTDTDQTDLCLAVSDKTPQGFKITMVSTGQGTTQVGYLVLDSKPDAASRGSRFGFHAGYANFRNLQFGKITVTTSSNDSSGDVITFPHTFKHLPMVFLSFDKVGSTPITTGFPYINIAPTKKIATIGVTGCSVANDVVDITWVAFDPGFSVGEAGTFVETVGQKAGNLAGQKLQSHLGIHSGEFHAKNLFGGVVLMTPSSGDNDEAVTFGQMMKNVPVVFAFKQDPVDDTTGVAYVKSADNDGVSVGIEAAETDDEASIGYLVFDYEYRQEGAPES